MLICVAVMKRFIKWDANTAILSGDSMLVLAYERMAQCDEKHLAKVLKLFTTTALELVKVSSLIWSLKTVTM